MRNENNAPCEFCKDKVSGDNFFTTSNDYGSGFIFKKHSMQYCPIAATRKIHISKIKKCKKK